MAQAPPLLTKGAFCQKLGPSHAPIRPKTRPKSIWRLVTGLLGLGHIGPASLHPNVGLVHAPGAVAHPQMRADSLFEFPGIGLEPAKDRRVVDLDAAITQHKLEITVTDRKTSDTNGRPRGSPRR